MPPVDLFAMAAAAHPQVSSPKPAKEQWEKFIGYWRAARSKKFGIELADDEEPLSSSDDLRDMMEEVDCIIAAGFHSKYIHNETEAEKLLKRLERGQQAAMMEIVQERGPMCLLTEGDSILVGNQSLRVWVREMHSDPGA